MGGHRLWPSWPRPSRSTESVLAELLHYDSDPISLDAAVGEDGDTSLGDLVVNHSAQSPFETVAQAHAGRPDRRISWAACPRRNGGSFPLRYGLDRGEPRTQGEVGELLDLTAERVRRIERDALHQAAAGVGGQRRSRPPRQLTQASQHESAGLRRRQYAERVSRAAK